MTEALFTRPLPVDWFRLLADLAHAGLPNIAVAAACTIPESTVRNIKYGHMPSHANGETLCVFYSHVLSRPAPRMKLTPAANEYT